MRLRGGYDAYAYACRVEAVVVGDGPQSGRETMVRFDNDEYEIKFKIQVTSGRSLATLGVTCKLPRRATWVRSWPGLSSDLRREVL